MLSQHNSDAETSLDLVENSIFVSGESDGSFDKDDYILFFAEGPDNIRYDQKKKIFSYQSNLYSKKNFYFITVSQDNGKRLVTSEDIQGTFPACSTFRWLRLSWSGRIQWLAVRPRMVWWTLWPSVTSYAYRFDVSVVYGRTHQLRSCRMSWLNRSNGSSFKLLFNKTQFAEQVVPTISNTSVQR